MARLLLLSNGHGEDLSGALLGQVLKAQGHDVEALPLVGRGNPYSDATIPLVGRTREFSTGGLGYTTLRGRLTELVQGQVIYLLRRLLRLIRIAGRYDLVVVIGDVIPVMAAWLCQRPVATYLVAYSSHYEGRLRLPWPCGSCLRSQRFQAVFSRDALTAQDLSEQLKREVVFVGNPFMDSVLSPSQRLPYAKRRLGLLPGSRRPELEHNLLLLLGVIDQIPLSQYRPGELEIDLALVGALGDDPLHNLAQSHGWSLVLGQGSSPARLEKDGRQIQVRRKGFTSVLLSSDLLLCMAGTAAEQAVGMAKPVLQLPGQGPQFTAGFAEAQRRLLGPTVFCAAAPDEGEQRLKATAKLAVELLERSVNDPDLRRDCREQAMQRLGPQGGGSKMADWISGLLEKS
ncbi:lipid-A-disaccharide synthase-related protein [bacterium]|nr:lipid-A-disaccharide synthase-related protein [bacterium]